VKQFLVLAACCVFAQTASASINLEAHTNDLTGKNAFVCAVPPGLIGVRPTAKNQLVYVHPADDYLCGQLDLTDRQLLMMLLLREGIVKKPEIPVEPPQQKWMKIIQDVFRSVMPLAGPSMILRQSQEGQEGK
jgi:hypothetical protein